MAKCTYVATGIVADTSVLLGESNSKLYYEGETLPEITRQIRKLVKLVHGNLIRTALIEDGIYHFDAMGRKKSNADMTYSIDIFVRRDQDRAVDIK